MNDAIKLFGFPPTHFGLSLRRFLEAQPTASHPVPISTLRARLLGRAEAPAGASRLSPQERRTLPAQEVLEIITQTDDFKFNCNLVMIDFFLRHGILGPDHPEYEALTAAFAKLKA